MTTLDWLIVIAINGAVVAYGLYLARDTRTTSDWFLAARSLPWWIVGLSLFATAIDSSDYVAILGGAYQYGVSNLATWWLGLPIGWFLVTFVILIPVYRTGMFTNAEYLEYRFGPTARLLSALIQLQYRTNVLGNVAFSLFLTFAAVTGLGREKTWALVVAIAMSAAIYTALGGLKAVAVTDAIQSVFMIGAAGILWLVVWGDVGGWSGLEARLAARDPQLVEKLMHVGGRTTEGVPAALMVFGWVVAMAAYAVVNQSQAMRMLAARSIWDMRTAALFASVVTVMVMGFNVTLGVLGHGLFPDLESGDALYPMLLQRYLGPGLLGLVLAGLLAGALSTYDSIGSALAAVLTRDVYARFLVRTGDDRHYLRVSRILTVCVILISFGYVPFLGEGMISFYLRLTSVAVIPLFTVYVLGTLTRVHRRSGAVGLVAGIGYGLSSLLGERLGWPLPPVWTNGWWAYVWSIAVTSGAMLAVTAFLGWEPRERIGALLYSGSRTALRPEAVPELSATSGTWLDATRRDASSLAVEETTERPWYARSGLWALVFILVVAYLNLVLLW